MNTGQKLPTKSTEFRILLLILIITIINYFDRSALSFSITPIQKTFSINNESFGFIASAFAIGYLIMSFFAGFLVDRYGVLKVWSLAAIIWSLATFLVGFSQGFWSLFFLRVLLGLAEAFHFPALLKAITYWLEPYWRSRCVAIGLLGVPLASVIGAPFLAGIIHSLGWRTLFILLGLIGVVWALIWVVYIKKVQHRYIPFSHPVNSAEQLLKTSVKIENVGQLKEKLFSPIFLGNCLNYFVFGYIVFFALAWLPGYLQQTFNIKILKTGALIMFPWSVSAIFLILGGFVSDHLWKKSYSLRKARILPIGFSFLLSGICFLLVSFNTGLKTDLLLLSLGMGFAFFANAPIYSLNADLFENRVGTAQGIMTAFFALAGIISPSITGWVSQKGEGFHSAFCFIFILCFIGFINSFFIQKVSEE